MLFQKLREPIFLKTSSELEEKLTSLKAIENNIVETSKIKEEIRNCEAGLKGEREIIFELKNAHLPMYVLHDVTINYENTTAQIDFIVITPSHCFFLECKNLYGDVTINEHGEFRREYMWNNKYYKESIYSPFRQTLRHIDIFHKKWLSENPGLQIFLQEKKLFDNYFKPLVVMANSNGMLKKTRAPKDIKNYVIRADQLVEYLKNDLQTTKKENYYKEKNMAKLAYSFLDKNVEVLKLYDEKYTLKDNKDILKDNLIQFRKFKSKKMNVPAYYIFTNDELAIILEQMPHELTDLKTILSPIKVQCHGEEILKLINESGRR